MSHEVWKEIYDRLVQLIESHRTTLITVNTRRLAERMAHQLSERLGDGWRRCPPWQPCQGGASGRRTPSARRQAQGAGGDGVARARHRYRPRRSGLPDLVAAPDRNVSAADRALRSHDQGCAQGPHLPADARRSDRMRGDGARGARRRARPHQRAGPAARRARAADRRRGGRRAGVGRGRLARLVPPGLSVSQAGKSRSSWKSIDMLARGYATRRGRPIGSDPLRQSQPQDPRSQGFAHGCDHERRRDSRGVRLPRASRAGRPLPRHAQRGLRDRVAARRRVPARQRFVAHPPDRQRRRARRRRPWPATFDAVLARRGARAQRRDECGGLASAGRR